jgi:lysophospholipase L1-like esterase
MNTAALRCIFALMLVLGCAADPRSAPTPQEKEIKDGGLGAAKSRGAAALKSRRAEQRSVPRYEDGLGATRPQKKEKEPQTPTIFGVKPPKDCPATRAAPKGRKWWDVRHAQLKEAASVSGGAELVFLGDSITDQWAQAGKRVWRERYEARGAINLGIGGDCTQHVLWRLQDGALEGLAPKVVVVMIGTNNAWTDPADEIAAGVIAVVQEVQRRAPEAKVLLLGIFPRGERLDDPQGALTQAANQRLAPLADGVRVRYLDLGEALAPGGVVRREVMPDHLHLSEAGYRRWAEAIEPTLLEWLGR